MGLFLNKAFDIQREIAPDLAKFMPERPSSLGVPYVIGSFSALFCGVSDIAVNQIENSDAITSTKT
jgi:hypothetical protein